VPIHGKLLLFAAVRFLAIQSSSTAFWWIHPCSLPRQQGGLLSTAMYAAPIRDMRIALARGSLGDLSPFPFAMMSGNTFGWLVYAYLVWDPFLIAANLPGFVLSLWLNMVRKNRAIVFFFC
jgi:Sugar efflux transporter for intercellular exchange